MNLNNSFHQLSTTLSHLFFPQFCMGCESEISTPKQPLCPVCEFDLPFTHFEQQTDPTNLDKLFWGRVPIHRTYALLFFKEGNVAQQLIHALKYHHQQYIGSYTGKLIGERLNKEDFQDVDAVVPVPLHHRKAFLRGYNQAEEIAKGICAVKQWNLQPDLLSRKVFTESQTKQNKHKRWDQLESNFQGHEANQNYQHIVIVDDVVTTGSTIETCFRQLQALFPNTKISVVAIAVATD